MLNMVARPWEEGQWAVGGSGQDLRREIQAMDTDPKLNTLWVQLKLWRRMGQSGAEDRVWDGTPERTNISG